MATLTGNTIASTYALLLKIDSTGIAGDGTLRKVEDGDATDSALSLSDVSIAVDATDKIFLDGGTHSYIHESASDVVQIVAGGTVVFEGDTNSRISLSNNDSGTDNTVFGESAGNLIASGDNYNTFIGHEVADADMTNATYNTAVGYQALSAMTTPADFNTAIGAKALTAFTTGLGYNNALGYQAGLALQTGWGNVFLGTNAGKGTTLVDKAICIGYGAGQGVMTAGADESIIIGYVAGGAITSATGNTVVGSEALKEHTTGGNNTVIGYHAADGTQAGGTQVTSAGSTDNIFIGVDTGGGSWADAASNYNVAIGNYAMDSALAAVNQSVAVGYGALGSVTQGDYNTCIGYYAGTAIQTGQRNIAIGALAYDDAAGDTQDNIAIGYAALGNLNHNSSIRNIGLGQYAGDGMGTLAGSIDNIFIGYDAGGGTWTTAVSTFNVAIGNYALDAAMNGAVNNTAVGYDAMSDLIDGGQNTCIGKSAGNKITAGDHNIIIGDSAGANDINLTTGDSNILIGNYADVSTADAQNQIAIGYNVSCTANSTITVGDVANTASLGLDGSDTSWAAASSDERYKENIETSNAGLSFVNDLRPVTYNWKKAKDVQEELPLYKEGSEEPVLGHEYGETLHGFIAQEVKTVIDNHSELKEGFKMWKEYDSGVQTVADGNLIPMLVKAVQELSAEVESLKEQLNN